MRPHNLRPCRFTIDDIHPHDGFTDGTYWNGFLNVSATPETIELLRAELDALPHGLGGDEAFDGLEAGEDGLISLANGFATSEWEEDDC
jgi:hypothetical protein